MIRHIAMAFLVGAFLPIAACTEKKQPEPEVEERSVREQAEAVGKFGDRTLTNNLEKSLTGIVDAADERNKVFEEQPSE